MEPPGNSSLSERVLERRHQDVLEVFMSGPSGGDESWIGAMADRFDQAWRAGNLPRIEDYLTGEQGTRRSWLLEELLRIERELRFTQGEDPTPDEYQGRFPEDGQVIDAVFMLTLPPIRKPGFDEFERLR